MDELRQQAEAQTTRVPCTACSGGSCRQEVGRLARGMRPHFGAKRDFSMSWQVLCCKEHHKACRMTRADRNLSPLGFPAHGEDEQVEFPRGAPRHHAGKLRPLAALPAASPGYALHGRKRLEPCDRARLGCGRDASGCGTPSGSPSLGRIQRQPAPWRQPSTVPAVYPALLVQNRGDGLPAHAIRPRTPKT